MDTTKLEDYQPGSDITVFLPQPGIRHTGQMPAFDGNRDQEYDLNTLLGRTLANYSTYKYLVQLK